MNKADVSYFLIWTSTFIGGFGVVLFVLATMFVTHGNGWLLVLFAAPILVFICLVCLLIGLVLRNKSTNK